MDITPLAPKPRAIAGKLPRIRRPPVLPRGPRLYSAKAVRRFGPGDPPPGFVGGTNSTDEWYIYWAVAKVTGYPKDPREPPFQGWPGVWDYQTPALGGFTRSLGSAVIDFVIDRPPEPIALRVVSERYHIYASAQQQAGDRLQRVRLVGDQGVDVFDLFSQDFVEDSSGRAAISVVRDALSGTQRPDPTTGGTQERTRLGRM